MKLRQSFLSALTLVLASTFVNAQDAAALTGPGLPSRKPAVTTDGLERLISRSKLLAHAEQFFSFAQLSNGNRAFGSKGHEATIQYIKRLLDRTGYYDVEFQTFTYPYAESRSQLTVDGKDLLTQAFTYSPGGDVTAPIAIVSNVGCEASDYPTLTGKIALIKRGDCDFGLKVAYAGGAGASGAIIYTNVDTAPSGGTLGQPSRPEGPYVPSAFIHKADGEAFISRINAGEEVVASIHATAISEDRSTSNVIATTKQGDRDNIIVAGAHSDSVPAGPGLNDDGSGSMGILEVALNLAKFKVKNAVRFIWWSAEEFGLVGSEYYVEHLSDEERQKIALYLNFDMIASPNAGFFVFDGDGNATDIPGPAGSEVIETLYRGYFDSHNIRTGSAVFGGSSDYQPFVDVGIPSGGLMTGAGGLKTAEGAEWWGGEAGVAYDRCYHQLCDNLENLFVDAWERNSKAIAYSIATYAQGIEGIPRTPRPPTRTLRVSKLSYEQRLHLTCDHDDDAA
ncbi:hypothetical protein EST38_g1495 [Candolleomyces aberdarensis]|uniref:Peptide hydrolase n=1 Tax=Candolleomyces aberdarensis TaxID=2316362 RepID=A0A4Q2DX04_9AGAR|nr:hypothetical protein EST38_g1495 [Candolleomyces aberdarensis]